MPVMVVPFGEVTGTEPSQSSHGVTRCPERAQ
jgi:hypothetical protein